MMVCTRWVGLCVTAEKKCGVFTLAPSVIFSGSGKTVGLDLHSQ